MSPFERRITGSAFSNNVLQHQSAPAAVSCSVCIGEQEMEHIAFVLSPGVFHQLDIPLSPICVEACSRHWMKNIIGILINSLFSWRKETNMLSACTDVWCFLSPHIFAANQSNF